jgi:hypothetical protein
MMKRDLRFSRRNLLQSIGAGAALLPLLESDRADAACVAGGIKRIYFLCWPNGMLSSINSWATAGNDPTSWTLAPFQVNAGLTPYMQDLLLLNGVDYSIIKTMPGSGERTGHACYPAMLTGAAYQTLSTSTAADIAGGISVDQYIGSALKTSGYGGLVSLNQGTFVQSTGHLSWKAAGQVVLPNLDPTSVFSQLFAGQMTAAPAPVPTATGTGMVAAPAPVDNSKKIKASILDYVSADLNRFANVVGTADKQAIEQHLTEVRSIESTLQMMGATTTPVPGQGPVTIATGSASNACTPPSVSGVVTSQSSAGADKLARIQMDLGLAALAADYTRVVVMQICDQGAGQFVMTWVNDPSGVPYAAGGLNPPDHNTGDVNGFHAIAHRNVQDKVLCDTWFQSNIAYLISRMKTIADMTGKTMLDSSAIVGMNNMRAGLHDTVGVPVIMAGSLGGAIKTGRSLALPSGTPNNHLLTALCNAMGTPAPGGGTYFGDTQYTGTLTNLAG